jgi:hypothetical protein
MSGLEGFPRRRRPAPQRTVATARAEASTRLREPAGEATREALDIARYVADMAAQLEAMSAAVDLDLLAYFLGMAKAEADMFLRAAAEPDPTIPDLEAGGLGSRRAGPLA